MQELPPLLSDDGFVERLIFFVTAPHMLKSAAIKANKEKFTQLYGNKSSDRMMFLLGRKSNSH